jgi:hypothetical protein
VTETQERPLGKRIKHGVESKILVPVAAAIVSAATRYLIKKLPLLLEEKVLPRLREQDAPQPVVQALEQTVATIDGDAPDQAPAAGAETSMSNDEREEERKKRAQRRRQRKSASAKAA